jgi:integrase/recombinase XerD
MSIQISTNILRFEQLKTHLRDERYSISIQKQYLWSVSRFLEYLMSKDLEIEAVHEVELEDFLRWELHSFRQRNGRAPCHFDQWRRRYLGAVHMVLRLTHGCWPVPAEPTNTREVFHSDVVQSYDAWMQELRGLAPVTRSTRIKQARQFLTALDQRGDQVPLKQLSTCDIDAYIQQQCNGLRRATIESCTVYLRCFLRYLHSSGRTALDLSGVVIGPRIYEGEHIPSALRPEEVEKVLMVTQQDDSPTGRRDYAFLMLLAIYGLRAREIVALRLEDIDWNKDVLHVQHSKTGTFSELPLLREPGEAILSYLQEARPQSPHRELFLHIQAPYRAYKGGSILNCVIGARLKEAGQR